MAHRISAKITKVSASHVLFLSQAQVVANTIDTAAQTLSKGQ